MNAEEKYQAELKQSDIDHHTPTAGAMMGHIIANLAIHSLKINQASLFARGAASLFLSENAKKWLEIEGGLVYRTPHGKIHLVIKVC